MRRLMSRVAALAGVLLISAASAQAGMQDFSLGLGVPPVILDTKAPPSCTVTWLLDNTANNDIFAARMRIDPGERDTPVNGRMPCPTDIAPRVADRALEVCANRTADSKTCVFADMTRDFEDHPDIRSTAENGSRCTSDKAAQIALACWMSGGLAVCNVGCGDTAEAAKQSAKARCEDKQQRRCPVTASVPVSGP
jgi:hypothetical protein